MPKETTDKLEEIKTWIDTKEKRHNFYCASTLEYTQEIAVFCLCVTQFRKDHKKRQAKLLDTWFIEGHFPAPLIGDGYMAQLNLSQKVKSAETAKINSALKAVGKTFSDKIANHGGGVRGFGQALSQKFGDATGLNPHLFDEAVNQTLPLLLANPLFISYNPSQARQPNGNFAGKAKLLAKHLKEGGFDAENLGLY